MYNFIQISKNFKFNFKNYLISGLSAAKPALKYSFDGFEFWLLSPIFDL